MLHDEISFILFRFSYSSFQKLLQAVEDDNVDQFTEVLKEYDSISRLDPFLTTLLLRVKKQLNAEPELC